MVRLLRLMVCSWCSVPVVDAAKPQRGPWGPVGMLGRRGWSVRCDRRAQPAVDRDTATRSHRRRIGRPLATLAPRVVLTSGRPPPVTSTRSRAATDRAVLPPSCRGLGYADRSGRSGAWLIGHHLGSGRPAPAGLPVATRGQPVVELGVSVLVGEVPRAVHGAGDQIDADDSALPAPRGPRDHVADGGLLGSLPGLLRGAAPSGLTRRRPGSRRRRSGRGGSSWGPGGRRRRPATPGRPGVAPLCPWATGRAGDGVLARTARSIGVGSRCRSTSPWASRCGPGRRTAAAYSSAPRTASSSVS